MSDGAGWYLNKIGAVALLNAQEERELSQIIQRGAEARRLIEQGERGRDVDEAVREAGAAKDRFIRANLRLVVSLASRYPLPPGMERLDLVQEGNFGLMRAVDKFDWRKEVRFSTYAVFFIRQAISRALDQKASLVRLPVHRSVSLRAALRRMHEDGVELDDKQARLHRLITPTSLDRIIDGYDDEGLFRRLTDADSDDDSVELIDLLPEVMHSAEVEVMAKTAEERVIGVLDVLEDRAKRMVQQHFGLFDGRRRTYREMSAEFGVTYEAIRQMVRRSLNKIRYRATKFGIEP